MDELSPQILAELQALADGARLSPAARDALLTPPGAAVLGRLLQQQAPPTMVPADLTLDGSLLQGTAIASDPVSLASQDTDPLSSLAAAGTDGELAHTRSGSHYIDLGVLGQGGMGEVRRVRDPDLNRVVALKIIRPERLALPGLVARFIEEAQITAQLEHPAIVPVYGLGRLPDGRYFFTMKQVRGQTMDAVIRSVHRVWGSRPTDWNVRRLLDAFLRVCEAVAYAHDRGVVHRDLKPSNIMLGPYGEVLVMDWGLAKVVGRPDRTGEELSPLDAEEEEEAVQTARTAETRIGRINGTPSYMPPEQASGRIDLLGPPSDVYALGAILFEILTGQAPFGGDTVAEILEQVRAGARRPFPEDLHIPEGLRALCAQAMAHRAEDRYANAQALSAALRSWREGAARRAEALAVVAQADALRPNIEALQARAQATQAQAHRALEAVPPHAPEAQKAEGWRLEDEAEALRREAALAELSYVQTLQNALKEDPELPEAHERLADLHRDRHQRAEDRHDAQEAALQEVLLRAHDRGQHRAYLQGDGALSLQTSPRGAEVLLFRYRLHRRRLRPVFEAHLGHAPLRDVPLPMGSYLLVLRAPGRHTVRYPVAIGRQQHWQAPAPIPLPPLGALLADEAYVPPGPFLVGGDPQAYQSLPRHTLHTGGFCIQRFPVTNRRYIAFLDDLVAQGREEDALRWAPRERTGSEAELGPLLYGRDAQGRFLLQADAEGDIWAPDWPVVMVDQHGALAYAAWLSDQTGLPWRLPRGLEREKAARGVDGRFFPWGDLEDPSWSCSQLSHADRPTLAPVTAFPVDVSPYGARHLGGLVRDWCIDAFVPEGEPHPDGHLPDLPPAPTEGIVEVRGGSWINRQNWARAALRFGYMHSSRFSDLGIRLVRTLAPPTPASRRDHPPEQAEV